MLIEYLPCGTEIGCYEFVFLKEETYDLTGLSILSKQDAVLSKNCISDKDTALIIKL